MKVRVGVFQHEVKENKKDESYRVGMHRALNIRIIEFHLRVSTWV
jgi:hypothetical protein